MLRRIFVGREMPDIITVLVTRQKKGGGYVVQFIAERERSVPKAPQPTTTLTETRTLVDGLISDYYSSDELFAELLLTQHVGVGCAMYPWDGSKKAKKDAAAAIGADYFMFDVEEVGQGFVAAERRTNIEVDALDLDALASAASNAVLSRWASALDGEPIPGMLNWQRVLTASGFTPFRRQGPADGAS